MISLLEGHGDAEARGCRARACPAMAPARSVTSNGHVGEGQTEGAVAGEVHGGAGADGVERERAAEGEAGALRHGRRRDRESQGAQGKGTRVVRISVRDSFEVAAATGASRPGP